MISKKIKAMAALVILLVIVCGAVICGEWNESPSIIPCYLPEEPAPPLPFSEITKICFFEIFGDHSGGRYQVSITATKDLIQFICYKSDVLGEQEEGITRNFECGQSAWDELMAVFNDNHVNTWKCQGYYLDEYYGQFGVFKEWSEVEFVKEGDFFNITDMNRACPQAIPPYYYGIDQNEKKFRSDYYGSFGIYTNNDELPYLSSAYESYGVPKEYNRFRKEFWDFIVEYTEIPDWRLELGDWGRENLYKKYPYMLPDGQERKIRYFSILENYGGKESAVRISLVYDGGGQSILYQCCSFEKIYSVGKSGLPVLYCERNPVSIWKLRLEKEVPEVPEGLSEIIERYEVGSWETETDGTEYVRQGEFYNIENAKQVKYKKAEVLRSGYDTLIHVVYTDGDHVEIQLENGRLPEAYNDFRDELWDYIIPYINEGKAEEEQAVDWRDMIDQWGQEYLPQL